VLAKFQYGVYIATLQATANVVVNND